MTSRARMNEIVQKLRGPEYDKRKHYYRCVFPKTSDFDFCTYIGTHSEVTVHLARHMNMYMYTCQLCTKEIFDQTEVYTHRDGSNKPCNAGPQNMSVHVPSSHECVDWWRLRNVYILSVTKSDYDRFKAEQANTMMLTSGRRPPGTPGYDDDPRPARNAAQPPPPPRYQHRSKSRESGPYGTYQQDRFSQNNGPSRWNNQSDTFRQDHQSSLNNSFNTSRPDGPNSFQSAYQNRQPGWPPGANSIQPRTAEGYGEYPNNQRYRNRSNSRSFAPSNRSVPYGSYPESQNKPNFEPSVSTSFNRSRANSNQNCGWGRSPSPNIQDITPIDNTQAARARSPDMETSHDNLSSAASFRRSREASKVPVDEEINGSVSLAIQRPKEMTRQRRSSVNYRSPAREEYYSSAKELEEISRNQQRFQVEHKGTVRVVPNRNRMTALLSADLASPDSETMKRRKARLKKLEQTRGGSATDMNDFQPQTKKVRPEMSGLDGTASVSYQPRSPSQVAQGSNSPAPVPPPRPPSRQHIQSNNSGFSRSPPSDDDMDSDTRQQDDRRERNAMNNRPAWY